ncbi:MAG: HipA N-terminal domain-containing protein, partial [Aestuariivirga sp.]|nr:HipA N-terminal domain-containing protein [Aestuariivirga sp.]
MNDLALDVRLDGFSSPIGSLKRDYKGRLSFVYRQDYLKHAAAIPLSLSLPLTDEPVSDNIVRAYFDNLLQERDAPLRSIMAKHDISRDDVAGLLLHLGKDCAGAVSILPEGAPPTKVPGVITTDYDPLNDSE